jgi:hypothetical protein
MAVEQWDHAVVEEIGDGEGKHTFNMGTDICCTLPRPLTDNSL